MVSCGLQITRNLRKTAFKLQLLKLEWCYVASISLAHQNEVLAIAGDKANVMLAQQFCSRFNSWLIAMTISVYCIEPHTGASYCISNIITAGCLHIMGPLKHCMHAYMYKLS